MNFLGIDVGKTNLHLALVLGDDVLSKCVPNSAAGLAQLQRWLNNRKVMRVHACLEATGGWSEGIAAVLFEAGHLVSIVNPARIKAFAQSEMLRTKTDRVDAALIARFCRMHRPDPWTPPAPEVQELQSLVRRHEALLRLRADEQNRLEAPAVTTRVKKSIKATISHIDREIAKLEASVGELFEQHESLRRQHELLVSIPGIGSTTAARILAEMPNIALFRNAKAVAAFAGLSPRHYESGSIRWPSRLSKSGNAKLRNALYFPAVTAIRFNPTLKAMADRLRKRGKANMTIIGAIMRKLLVLAYGVLKSGRAFDVAIAA